MSATANKKITQKTEFSVYSKKRNNQAEYDENESDNEMHEYPKHINN